VHTHTPPCKTRYTLDYWRGAQSGMQYLDYCSTHYTSTTLR
jgi:hypothetical protein